MREAFFPIMIFAPDGMHEAFFQYVVGFDQNFHFSIGMLHLSLLRIVNFASAIFWSLATWYHAVYSSTRWLKPRYRCSTFDLYLRPDWKIHSCDLSFGHCWFGATSRFNCRIIMMPPLGATPSTASPFGIGTNTNTGAPAQQDVIGGALVSESPPLTSESTRLHSATSPSNTPLRENLRRKNRSYSHRTQRYTFLLPGNRTGESTQKLPLSKWVTVCLFVLTSGYRY